LYRLFASARARRVAALATAAAAAAITLGATPASADPSAGGAEVSYRTAITGFAPLLDPSWPGLLDIRGCVTLTRRTSAASILLETQPSLTLQYAASRRGPWRVIDSTNAQSSYIAWDGGCGNGGVHFDGSVPVVRGNGYYRTVFPGQAVAAGFFGEDDFLASASPAMHAQKWLLGECYVT
jgi:hypothetical protein